VWGLGAKKTPGYPIISMLILSQQKRSKLILQVNALQAKCFQRFIQQNDFREFKEEFMHYSVSFFTQTA
jgi:hypothetical protein